MSYEKIKHILCEEFEIDEQDISLDASIYEDLGLDSETDIYDLVMSVEDTFEIELPDEDLEEIETVEDLVKFIESKI